jgi:hypothetical protein
VVSFPRVSQTKSCMQLAFPPCGLHAPLISSFSIWSPECIWWGVQIIKLLIIQGVPGGKCQTSGECSLS